MSSTPSDLARKIGSIYHAESIARLAAVVRIPSLTGEEGEAQRHIAELLEGLGGVTESLEPDIKALFESFPHIAQYPTHWQHDLVLPYSNLPTLESLQASGLESVLNYKSRPNVVATFPGTGGGRSLILNGHIDTVTIEPTNEWTRDPFGGQIEDGLMYGRGTSDMKGGLMAAIMALTYLKRAGAELRGDVIVQCVVNEEHAGNGTLDLMRRGYTANAAIVLEPTNNTVAVSHPGGLYWQIRVPGRQSSPGARWNRRVQNGVSAIEKLPRVIDALIELERGYNEKPVADWIETENGSAPFSLVVGKVTGGFYETVTAGEAILRGSAYFAPGVGNIGDVMNSFRHAVDGVNAGDTFLTDHPAQCEFLHHDDSTHQSPQISPAAQMCSVLEKHGGKREIHPGSFACDMRHLVNQGDIPSIIFGPGTIAQAHKPDEHIRVQEYLDCINYLIEFIWAWCNMDLEQPLPGVSASRVNAGD